MKFYLQWIESIAKGNLLKSTDLWQIKILNVLMKKRHFQDILPTDFGSLLLAPELLNSLLIKIKMMLERELLKHKAMLKRLSNEANLNFLQSFDLTSIHRLMQLANYTDLPLQLGTPSPMNLIQFLIGFRSQCYHYETDFISNIWKIIN